MLRFAVVPSKHRHMETAGLSSAAMRRAFISYAGISFRSKHNLSFSCLKGQHWYDLELTVNLHASYDLTCFVPSTQSFIIFNFFKLLNRLCQTRSISDIFPYELQKAEVVVKRFPLCISK